MRNLSIRVKYYTEHCTLDILSYLFISCAFPATPRFRISYKCINIRSPLIIRNHVRVSHPLLSRMCVRGLLKEEKCRTARVI